jgi:hypothetical protein
MMIIQTEMLYRYTYLSILWLIDSVFFNPKPMSMDIRNKLLQ